MNTPNKLSVARLISVPLFIIIYLFPYGQFGISIPSYSILWTEISVLDIVCFLFFVGASLTDMLDGHIARKYHLITTFGKFIDPIADKALVNSSMILLTMSGRMNIVLLLIMILRDTFVDGVRMVAAGNNKVVAASYWGKAKTVTQMVGISLILLNNPFFTALNFPLDQVLMYLATFFSVVSGIKYIIACKDYIFKSM